MFYVLGNSLSLDYNENVIMIHVLNFNFLIFYV